MKVDIISTLLLLTSTVALAQPQVLTTDVELDLVEITRVRTVEPTSSPRVLVKTVTEWRDLSTTATVTESKCAKSSVVPVSSTTSTTSSRPIMPSRSPAIQPTLLPVVMSHQQSTDPANLQPKKAHSFYYAGSLQTNDTNGAVTLPIANVGMNFTQHAVALEHTALINSITCENNDDLKVVFAVKSAFDIAKSSWPASGSDFVVVTYSEGCGDHAQGERTFNKVLSYTMDESTLTFVAEVSILSMRDVVEAGDVQFGELTPDDPARSGFAKGADAPGTPYYGVGVGQSDDGSCPAASVADNFDNKLDAALGTSSLQDQASQNKALPSLKTGVQARQAMRARTIRSRALLQKKWFWDDIVDAIVDVVDVVVNVVVDIWDTVSGNIKVVGQAIEAVGELIIDGKADFDALKTTLAFQYPGNNNGSLIKTPFSNAPGYLLDSDNSTGVNFAVYCVNCGVGGSLSFAGHVTFTLSDGLTAASLNFNGNMWAGLEIGIVADKKFEKKTSANIFTWPLGGIVIPKIFTFGPVLKMDAEFIMTFDAKGKMLTGATLNWSPETHIDLLNLDNSGSSGWEPVITPVVMLDGQLSISAELGLPISFAIELDILDGGFTASASITDRPGLTATVDLGVHAAMNDQNSGIESIIGSLKCPDAIAMSVDFKNEVYAKILDDKYPLNTISKNIWSDCIALPASWFDSPSNTTTSSSSTVSSTTLASSSASFLPGNATITANTDILSTTTTSPTTSDISSSTAMSSTTSDMVSSTAISSNSTSSLGSSTLSSSSLAVSSTITSPTATSMLVTSTTITTSSTFSTRLSSINLASTTTGISASITTSAQVSSITGTISSSIFSTNSTSSTSTNKTASSTKSVVIHTVTPPAKAKRDTNPSTVQIHDIKQTDLFLATNKDGSLFIDTSNRSCSQPANFLYKNGIVAADSGKRFLHFYSNEMNQYGVSRFRLHPGNSMPSTGVIIAITSAQDGNLVAVVPGESGAYYPIACEIEGQPTKMFLAKDGKAGIDTLAQSAMQDVLTGGRVMDCSAKNWRFT